MCTVYWTVYFANLAERVALEDAWRECQHCLRRATQSIAAAPAALDDAALLLAVANIHLSASAALLGRKSQREEVLARRSAIPGL